MTDSIKLLSQPVNFAVVQLPERKYPGVVVQGDTLGGFVSRLNAMKELLAARQLDELEGEIEDLTEIFSGALAFYQAVCRENSIQ